MNKIGLTIKKHSDEHTKVKGHIKLNGCKYKFTILISKENKISNESWNLIAEEAAKIALELINKNTLYKATVVLSGIPDEPSPSTEPTIEVKRVRVKKKEKSKFKKLHINQDKINENIENIRNELKNPASTKKTEIVSTIPTIQIAGDGRCLDRSIAYQIAAKGTPSEEIKTDDQRINDIADRLRLGAANKIKSNDYDQVPEFFTHLHSSIRGIPAFWEETRRKKEPERYEESLKSIKVLIEDEEIKAIEDILIEIEDKEYAFEKLKVENKNKLKKFYADYITQKTVSNNSMNNYLDAAFLYVLPDVEVNDNQDKHKYAVFSRNDLLRFPDNTELRADNTIFVVYNGENHYDAVDMNKAGEQLNKIIADHNNKIVADLFTPQKTSTTANQTKAYLLNDIKNQVPEAYKAIANYIYWYDHGKWKESVEAVKEWEKGDKQRPKPEDPKDEPGKTWTQHINVNYSPEQYGDFRLNQIEADHLKERLIEAKSLENLKQLAQELEKKEGEQK